MPRSHGLPVYPRKKLMNMPRNYELKDSIQLSVDYTQGNELESLQRLALQAADNRDNVGTDEANEYDSDSLFFRYGNIFTVYSNMTDSGQQQLPVAFFRIAPCFYARALHPNVATLSIFRDPRKDAEEKILQELFRIAEEFLIDLRIGYRICSMHIAVNCSRWLRIARRAGYNITAVIPNGVLIKEHGLVSDVILMKHLQVNITPVYSVADSVTLLHKFYPEQTVRNEFGKGDFVEIPFLPETYTFSCGIRSAVRTMEPKDFQEIYEMFCDAKEKTDGYFDYEMYTPSLVMYLFMDGYAIVYEDLSNGAIIGCGLMSESEYTRSKSAKAVDTDIIVSERYRDFKIGTEMLFLNSGILKKLGYKAIISDTLLSNVRVLHMAARNGIQILGCIPGLYCEQFTWEDQVVTLTDLTSERYPTFDDLLATNRTTLANSKL